MKKIFFVPSILAIAYITIAFVNYYRSPEEKITEIKKEVLVTPTKVEVKPLLIKVKNHDTFLEALGNFESGNNYKAVNTLGYMGRYQFGRKTLKGVGIKATKKQFLNSPSLQEEAMDRLLTANYKTLRRYIRKYDGKVLHGVLVTKSGVLAAAHLGGAANVRRWFRNGKNFADGNGTKITTYMKIFRGYNLDI